MQVRIPEDDPDYEALKRFKCTVTSKMMESTGTEAAGNIFIKRFPAAALLAALCAHDGDADLQLWARWLFPGQGRLIDILCTGHAARALEDLQKNYVQHKSVGPTFMTRIINRARKLGYTDLSKWISDNKHHLLCCCTDTNHKIKPSATRGWCGCADASIASSIRRNLAAALKQSKDADELIARLEPFVFCHLAGIHRWPKGMKPETCFTTFVAPTMADILRERAQNRAKKQSGAMAAAATRRSGSGAAAVASAETTEEREARLEKQRAATAAKRERDCRHCKFRFEGKFHHLTHSSQFCPCGTKYVRAELKEKHPEGAVSGEWPAVGTVNPDAEVAGRGEAAANEGGDAHEGEPFVATESDISHRKLHPNVVAWGNKAAAAIGAPPRAEEPVVVVVEGAADGERALMSIEDAKAERTAWRPLRSTVRGIRLVGKVLWVPPSQLEPSWVKVKVTSYTRSPRDGEYPYGVEFEWCDPTVVEVDPALLRELDLTSGPLAPVVGDSETWERRDFVNCLVAPDDDDAMDAEQEAPMEVEVVEDDDANPDAIARAVVGGLVDEVVRTCSHSCCGFHEDVENYDSCRALIACPFHLILAVHGILGIIEDAEKLIPAELGRSVTTSPLESGFGQMGRFGGSKDERIGWLMHVVSRDLASLAGNQAFLWRMTDKAWQVLLLEAMIECGVPLPRDERMINKWQQHAAEVHARHEGRKGDPSEDEGEGSAAGVSARAMPPRGKGRKGAREADRARKAAQRRRAQGEYSTASNAHVREKRQMKAIMIEREAAAAQAAAATAT